MSKLNTNQRQFNTVFRRSTVVDPRKVFDSRHQFTAYDYTDVPAISTRGAWPAVHMIDEDTFVQMAIAAGHVKAPKR